MARVSNLARPGATVQEAMAILDEDPARRLEGRENFRSWMQELAERTISELHGTHFDIPPPAHRIEAAIAPTNDGGIYYTGPSEDWSRPGRMWWSVPDGVEAFSTWKEVTVVYHEGVPGHHLQISHAMAQRESLLRRCLGLPGQAPSYKLGERIWLQAREDARARAGAAFSLKDFHAHALSLGAMGLDPLREALAGATA
jgi:uncharacterized protein (DUF885 family)